MSEFRRRIMIAALGGGEPPVPLPYDAEVEYLISDGTQYIDLQWDGSSATDAYYIDYRITTVVTQVRFFHGDSAPVDLYVNGSKYLAYSFNGTNYRATNKGCGTNVRRTYKVDFYNKTYTVDGASAATSNDSTGTSANMSLLRTGGSAFIGNVYAAKVWKSDVLCIDLIPVRIGQVGYMYDRVRGLLLPNSGSGNPFGLGPDKT